MGPKGLDTGVSKNRGTPKWMVKIMEDPIKMDGLGGNPPYFWNPKPSISIGFSIIFTIHFGGFTSIFGNTPIFIPGVFFK